MPFLLLPRDDLDTFLRFQLTALPGNGAFAQSAVVVIAPPSFSRWEKAARSEWMEGANCISVAANRAPADSPEIVVRDLAPSTREPSQLDQTDSKWKLRKRSALRCQRLMVEMGMPFGTAAAETSRAQRGSAIRRWDFEARAGVARQTRFGSVRCSAHCKASAALLALAQAGAATVDNLAAYWDRWRVSAWRPLKGPRHGAFVRQKGRSGPADVKRQARAHPLVGHGAQAQPRELWLFHGGFESQNKLGRAGGEVLGDAADRSEVQSLLKTQAAHQRTPYHPFCAQILQLMLKEGLIRGYTVEGNRITILLKHYQGAPVIRNVRVVSKPSRDIWLLPHELKFRTRNNTGLWIMQTPVGVVSHRECIEMGIGGKVIFAVNNGFQHWC
ncbi:unnamed protein product [Effrenium voratum]|uniref:Ribosomal protein S8 n=1 Tax=Effrenium voratum TaxID=2562239 RepID=A0AA36J625_9DINO|nr:unnamed protein product [Effrenium voratum]